MWLWIHKSYTFVPSFQVDVVRYTQVIENNELAKSQK